jgi:hypothetical protein
MNLLATFMSGANRWAQKMPKFVFGQITVCPVGVEKTAQPTVRAMQI